jgi:hypothetical protein
LYELCETALTYNFIIYTVKMKTIISKENELIINNTKIEHVRNFSYLWSHLGSKQIMIYKTNYKALVTSVEQLNAHCSTELKREKNINFYITLAASV